MPPFRADQVGSLIRPADLLAARAACARGEMTPTALHDLEDDAIVAAIRMQEDTGMPVITDGEFRRSTWHRDFLLKLSNVVLAPGRITMSFRTSTGESANRAPTAMAVQGQVSRPAPIFVDDFKFVQAHTTRPTKLTIPSPTILHFRGGRQSIDKAAYPDLEAFYADVAKAYTAEIDDLAAAGCTYLQVDDVNWAYLCDPRLREQVIAMGEDPDALPSTYARLINAAIATRPPGMTIGLHVCRGNASGGWLAEGGYEQVAETLFNDVAVDAFFLEYDSPRAGGFEPLRFLPKGKMAVLGMVSTKRPEMEVIDDLKRRFDDAARYVPLERLALSTQCGFSSGAHATDLSIDHQIAKLKLVVDAAKAIWGSEK